MKTPKFLFVALSFVVCLSAFAQRKEYFSVDRQERYGNAPRPLTSTYYGTEGVSKSAHELTFKQWFDGPHAMADIYGARAYIEDELGIVPNISYLGNFAANPVGGMSQGAAISSSVNLGYGIDLKKLTKIDALEGWSFANTWVWRFGDSLTKKRVGNQFSVQQNYGSQTIMLESLFLSWKGKVFGDSELFVKFGRVAAGDDFMTKPIYWLYMNNGFDGNPNGVFNQTPFSAYPGSTWGAFASIETQNGYYGKAGVYQINSAYQDAADRHGLDWSFTNADGVNVNFEFGWNINHDDSGRSPGNISGGVVLDWYSAEHLDNPAKNSHFNTSIYIQADYMIWNMGLPNRKASTTIRRSSPKEDYRDLRGLVLWGVIQFDPYDQLAKIPLFVNGGLLFNAPFESRPDDVLVFGVVYGKYSDKLTTPASDSYEVVLELNYKLQINQFSFVQPNVQYVLNPSGGQYSDALVLGCQFGVSF